MDPVQVVELALPARYDLDETLRFTRFGPRDPTSRRGPGWFVKATRTPDGPVTLSVEREGPSRARAAAAGPGARWILARLGALLGVDDQPPRLELPESLRPARRLAAVHLPRVPWILDRLSAFVFEQRVAFEDAMESHRRLVAAHGDDAPGGHGVRVPPDARAVLRIPDSEWRWFGVDRQRRGALRQVYRYAHRVHEVADMDLASARRRLAALGGVGPWTVEMTMGFGLGDPDAFPEGDYHLPDVVSWAFAGEPRGDDARMRELLEPYRGNRFRVIRMLRAARIDAPRFGPRRSVVR